MAVSVYKETTCIKEINGAGWIFLASGKRIRLKKNISQRLKSGTAVIVIYCKDFNGSGEPIPILVVDKEGNILYKKICPEGSNILKFLN